MTKNKLKLKRTPEEEEEQRRLKKERRREKKRRQEGGHASSSKRVHLEEDEHPQRKWASSDEEGSEYGPQPTHPSTAHKPDYDTLRAEIEEEMFRQKMFDAMGDDERLDSVEARFNDFAQVPDRWRTTGTGSSRLKMDEDEFLKMDPSMLDDEEYAEWIRAGMYRKTHAEEYAEQQRKKAAREARQAERKARKSETARLERQADNERRRKKAMRQSRKLDDARTAYHTRWLALLAPVTEDSQAMLSFEDIPWPIFSAYLGKSDKDSTTTTHSITVEELTMEAVSSFLLPVPVTIIPDADSQADADLKKRERKEKLRETFLRFHPDKFEGRFSKRIKDSDRERVKEAIGQVIRILNNLMGEGG
ncbi:hypothetical protein BJ165DRAFT_1102010 [Panaeolus papilionaceus]|nr:hypothetical protein BJ165DRAFT_1102010 [Panaeolus papilionaceus]